MGYTLTDGLSPKPEIVELADFWEIECLRRADSSVSILDIVKSKGIADDVQEEEDDILDFELEDEQLNVITEIQRRIKSCRNKYPFVLDENEWILSFNSKINEQYAWIYIYLLLATRANMLKNKIIDTIDGTEVFERLSTDVLTNYLGEYSKGFNFGTAAGGTFYAKLAELVKHLKEGELHDEKPDLTFSPKDDKLDIVAWIPFLDELPSKLICFAQCKTGYSWHDYVRQLNVDDFLKKWFSRHPAVNPKETFIITDVVPKGDFYNRAVNNIFFDRCRVLSFSEVNPANDWFDDLKNWTKGGMEKFELKFTCN